MPKLTPEARDQRRRALVDAGWRCVADKGYRNVTVDDVCLEAGLSKGSFYTYFDEKRDLLLALLEDSSGRVDELTATLPATVSGAGDRLVALLRALMNSADEPGRTQVQAELWAEAAVEDEVRSRLAAALRQRRSVLADWVREGTEQGELVDLPPNAFASVLLALADGLMVHAALDPGSFNWGNVQRAVTTVLGALDAR